MNSSRRICENVPPKYPGGIRMRRCYTPRQESMRRYLNESLNLPNSPMSSAPLGLNNNNYRRASFGPSTIRRNRSRKNRSRKNRSRKNRKTRK